MNLSVLDIHGTPPVASDTAMGRITIVYRYSHDIPAATMISLAPLFPSIVHKAHITASIATKRSINIPSALML